MTNCTNCGKELTYEAKFCPECGKEIKEEKLCQNCGSAITDGAKFCIECGGAVLDEKVDSKIEENTSSEVLECEPVAVSECNKSKSNSILAFAFAVPALVCALYCIKDVISMLFIFLPSMIVFFALSKSFAKKYKKEASKTNGFIKASSILTKIALPVGIVFACLCIVSGIVSFFTSPMWKEIVSEVLVFIDELLYEVETELLYELGISK